MIRCAHVARIVAIPPHCECLENNTIGGKEFCWPKEVNSTVTHILTIAKIEGLGDLDEGDAMDCSIENWIVWGQSAHFPTIS